MIDPTDKIEKCIRIASEYRDAAKSRDYSEQSREDAKQKLTWRDALPDKWAVTLTGRVVQAAVILFFPLFLFFIYIVVPLITFALKKRNARKSSRHAVTANFGALARASKHNNLYDLWSEHGLPEYSSNVDFIVRSECLKQWVDILYGSDMATIMRVNQRVEEVQAEHSRARAAFSARGGHISLMDPVDCVARELAKGLPTFQ